MKVPRSEPTGNAGKQAADMVSRMRLGGAGQSLTDRELLRGFLGPVLVAEPVHFEPAGAIVLPRAELIWNWLARDVEPQLSAHANAALAPDVDPSETTAFSNAVVALLGEQMTSIQADPEAARRVRVQIGDEQAYKALERVLVAFRCQPYYAKAVAFGRALNNQRDDSAIALSLKSFPAKQSPLMPMLMHASIGQVANPSRVVAVLARLASNSNEGAIRQSGFGSVIDAILVHAQNQLSLIYAKGPFADMDLACRAVARFHALIRAVSIVAETDTHCAWANQMAKLISHISDQLEPRIKRIEADVRQSLRLSRSENEGLDTELLLEALNGMYLLSTVRESRESLGVNSALETAWAQTGQVLEILITRNLDAFKANPSDEIVARKLEAAVNMARIRFNPEYAEIIKKAMDGASRRAHPASA